MNKLILGVCAAQVVALAPSVLAEDKVKGYVGIGGLVGSNDGHGNGAGVLELGGIGKQNGAYGSQQLRFEAGNGFGIALSGMGGGQIVHLEPGEKASLHVGLEPFNLNFSAISNKNREDFIEWSPMGSAGLQLGLDTCRILALGRAGGSIGTLGHGGGGGAYGLGAYVNCPRFDLAADLTRIVRNDKNVDMAILDASIPLKGEAPHGVPTLSLGLHGEVIDERADGSKDSVFSMPAGPTDRVEQRGLITLRGVF